jgi:transcriptional regulator with XRE-family HTH domain
MNKLRNTDQLIKFGNHLRGLRTSKKMTLEQLAFAADVELSQIYRIEKGKVNPTLTTLIALSNGLEISISDLLDNLFNTTN